MGQYYVAYNMDKKEWLKPHDFDNGAKLMEHSYLGNNFLGAVVHKLKKDWAGDRVVWVGDYYENENPKVQLEKRYLDNGNNLGGGKGREITKGFLNNHDTKQSIDLSKVTAVEEGYEDMIIHPLSLLTACGNGKGGGDFNDEKHYLYNLVGIWAGDHLSVSTKPKFETTRFFNNEPNSVNFILED